ncbi:MAG: hypothetical protein AMXMBFR33_72500 [Candidatus Xenobia bacterium]|jgi:hypothetical protein
MSLQDMSEASEEQREAILSQLEARELDRLREALLPVVSDADGVDKILASLTAIVYRRVSKSFHAIVEDLGGTVATKIIQLVHGSSQGFFVQEVRYGDWVRTHSGVVWLHPDLPYTLKFASGTCLQFMFALDGPQNGASFVPMDDGNGQIRIGLQTTPKLIPVNLVPTSDKGEALMEFLMQLYVTPTPYGDQELLRLDYATFWKARGELKGAEGS